MRTYPYDWFDPDNDTPIKRDKCFALKDPGQDQSSRCGKPFGHKEKHAAYYDSYQGLIFEEWE